MNIAFQLFNKLAFLTCFTVLTISCSITGSEKEDIPKPVTVNLTTEESYKLLNDTTVAVLDVRTAAEYESGHISGALLIPLQELQSRISEIGHLKTKKLMVYCRTGNRSQKALRILEQNGFTKLFHLEKGITAWIRDGYKVE